MSTKPEQHLKVGDWWYLPQQDKLVKMNENGEVTQTAELDNLCQKAINYFILNAGRLITRDEILQDVWGVRDVSDGRISRVIRVLRVALGDDSREPTYIETIPKRGFRFIAPIAEVVLPDPVELELPAEPQPVTVPSRSRTPIYRQIGIAAVLVLLACFAYLMLTPNQNPDQAETVPFVRYEAITSLVGLEFDPAVSSDGNYLAFTYKPEDSHLSKLMLQNLSSNEIRTLLEFDGAISGPTWRPDGMALAYQKVKKDEYCQIRLLSFTANRMNIVSDELVTNCGLQTLSGRMSWSPDGQFLVYPTWPEGEKNMVLMLHPMAGGQQERLTAPPQTSLGDYVAKYSKDGKYIAFLRYVGDSAGQIWIIDLETRSSRKLAQLSGIPPLNIDFINEDKEVIYPSSNASIISVDIKTLEQKVLVNTESLAHEIYVTEQGRLFVSVGNVRKTNISKQDNPLLSSNKSSQLIFHSSRNDSSAIANPVLSGPLAVYSNRSGLPQIWFYFDDGKQIQISKFTEAYDMRNMEFSSDGKSLLANVGNSIWVFSLDKPPIQLSSPEQIVLEPSWSSDGKFVYFIVSKEGRWQVVRTKADSKEQEIVSSEFDFYRESPDGKYLVFRMLVDKNYKLKVIETNEIVDLPITNPSYLHPNFVLRDSYVYFTEQVGDDKFSVKGFDLLTRNVKDTGVVMENSLRNFTVSRDERFIYLPVGSYGDIDIAELKLN